MLRLVGNDVRTASDGAEALTIAASFRPDVALLDIGMPRFNGHEVARRLRAEEWGKSMIIVAVTGWGQEDDRVKSLEAGCDFHLVKPVDPAELDRALARGS
jgi:DNA-binding response OmpR family regulator